MTLSPDFLHELKKRFTGDLRLDPASRTLYSTDASMYQIEPLGIAIPKTQDDLQAAVELAAKYAIPILPRGAGSSLGGQAIGEALILDCSRHLDSILKIDPDSQTATVEPGVVLSTLNAASAKFGLTFGPDPASAERATMGGVIGNNATGAHSILYGMSADHLVSADVIMADGSLAVWNKIVLEEREKRKDDSLFSSFLSTALDIREKYSKAIKQNFPKTWRNSAGYRLNYLLPWSPSAPPQWIGDSYPANLQPSIFNLATLLAGSEGTLAVMQRATVNLVKKPKHTILGVLAYQSIADACDDVPRLLEFKPSAIELIPQMIIQLARGVPSFARQMGWMTGNPAAVLVIEFSGDQPSALKEAVRRVGNVITIAESPEEQARVWNIRKMGLGILDSRPQAARPAAFIEDCAIPVERLGEFVREIERILREHHTEGGIYAHASGGCLHIRPILNLHLGEGVRALRSIGGQVLQLALRLGGSMSSEHGDGIATGEWIEKTYGAEVTKAMRTLKHAADPRNILNPKKMFDAPPMDTNLRYGENYQAKTWVPSLHLDHERGLAGAIEHCNGQGVCRKTNGVMCPSFQATRDEANSTRGRANLLRGLITDYHLPSAENARQKELMQATYQALDLCLACKGCTSECPSGVDMPKLKYEFMNEYYKTHRRHLRDYLFGYFHVVSKWLAPAAPLANAFMQMSWAQKLIARTTGITEKRPFPLFAKRSSAQKAYPNAWKNGKAVIFLSDVFSRYLEPEVEQAAFELLHAAGYEVKTLPIIGSGASLLSKGFVDAARKHAEKVLSEIHALDPDSTLSVVGCEPPEVYCLKHEYSALLPNRRTELESISRRVWLVDEFLLRDENLERLVQMGETAPHSEVIHFHPHCHQRAEGLSEDGLPNGTAATTELLRRFGFQVNLLDTGCCGMAGTFGYDANHYELSMQVGELKLFPTIRELGLGNGDLASSGSACRLQIKQGVGKTAEHPLVVIAKRISPNG
ncbi:MAG TPA: FAD-linked oxidase C-terminal domain-containing protein [Anaerolineales bacterium]|nr:FAD-linked oxidase C-terminal domain-containing protein [Anaerolineales bacterium]